MNFPIILFAATVISLILLRFLGDVTIGGGGGPLVLAAPGFKIDEKTVRFFMSIVVSLAVLGCAVFVILSKNYDSSAEKWAFGSVGTVIGYWLKGK